MGQVANNFGTSIWVLRLHFKLNEKIRTHFLGQSYEGGRIFSLFWILLNKRWIPYRFYRDKELGNSTSKETYTY
jgi:hypothetical protein